MSKMRRKGFSFACPMQASIKDEAFQRFLKTAKTGPDKIHNPWPQIACPDYFKRAYTQPLVNMSYLTTSNPDNYPSDMNQLITDRHEEGHGRFDFSPAKWLARSILADAYISLTALIVEEDWDADLWRYIRALNTKLSEICSAITLSEELFAMAYSFKIRSTDKSRKDLAKLGILESESVGLYQEEISPKFAELYNNTFKKIMGWVHNSEEDALVFILSSYLQSLQPNVSYGPNDYIDTNKVVDSENRCEILAEAVKHINNKWELLDWRDRNESEDEEDINTWAFTRLFYKRDQSDVSLWLWTLMEGRRPYKKVYSNDSRFESIIRAASKAITLYNNRKNRIRIRLYAHESENGWFIVPAFPAYTPRPQMNAAKNLFGLESLRQQLDEGKGICCPYYTPSECNCTSAWRKTLQRILQWAREGKFGRGGDWKDLPPECRCGV